MSLQCGREGDGARAWVKGMQKRAMGQQPMLLKSGSVARGREEKGRGRRGRVHVEVGEGGEGGPGAAVSYSGRLAMALDHRARAAPLPREQKRAAGMGDAGDGVSATNGRDWGEVGPGGSGWGAREKRESETGRWWGAELWAWVAWLKPNLKQSPNSNVSNSFKTWSIRKVLSRA
jgi:hypothetical protein